MKKLLSRLPGIHALAVSAWLGCLMQIITVSAAQASADIPLNHWAYEAVERLWALDLIDRAMLVQKPYSRMQAAKYVARAVERIRADKIPVDGREAIAEPVLARLLKELRPELIRLGVMRGAPEEKAGWLRGGAIVTVEGNAFFVGGGQTVRFRENRGGEYYANGVNNQTDVRGWLEVNDWAALMVQPKFISDRHTLGYGATNNSQNFYMREFSLKLSYFNIALEAGRGTQWWGPGYHGSLLLTNHAFPLDMIKLGSDQPFQLPWVLKHLGEWKINSFLAQLQKDRDSPLAKVFGLRLSWLPSRWLEIGLTRLTQYNGEGRDQSFPSAIFDAYVSEANQEAGREVNEQAMVDFRAKIPRIPYLVPFPAGMQLYGELGTEDKWSELPIPSRAAVLAGIYVPQLFAGDTVDLRVEFADTDLSRQRHPELTRVWYNNGTYTAGMRNRGFPLGHHMGTDGIDFFVRSTRFLTDSIQLGANFNFQQRDRGQPVHETKREAEVDLTWWWSSRLHFTFGYTYQRIENPGQITNISPFVETFAAGVTAKNHLFWTSMALQF